MRKGAELISSVSTYSNIVSLDEADSINPEVFGTLLTVSRIETIGELIASNVDIEKDYFTSYGLQTSDYQQFLQSNGLVITFSDSLNNKYKVPTTYINWPPTQNGYAYQNIGANIVLGPISEAVSLSSVTESLSGIIEQITGIPPAINSVELSETYLLKQEQATVLENIRYNNANGYGTPQYYQNILTHIQNKIDACVTYLNNYNYAHLIPLTIAIFGGGNGFLSTTSFYSFTTNTSSAQTSLSYSPTAPAAAGISTLAIFGGGFTEDYSSVTSIYLYSNSSANAGKNLSNPSTSLMATGNSTIAIFGGGSTLNNTISSVSLYNYAQDTVTAGANISSNRSQGAAVGNNFLAVFGGGISEVSDSVYLSSISVYTYSSNLILDAQNLTYSSHGLAASGNSTIGIFGAGYYMLNTSSIYNYTTLATLAGGSLSYSTQYLAAAGTSTAGVFGGGSYSLSTTSVYDYSSNASSAGSNLSYNSWYLAAASSNNVGVIQ